MERQPDTKDEESIRWHNAFCAATELELAGDVSYFQFGQPQEAAQKVIAEKYPDAGEELINSIIATIYERSV